MYKIALVTGASRGVGKGIARSLAGADYFVYITGRTVGEMNYLGKQGLPLICDHRDDAQVEQAFQRIRQDHARLDLLVNNVWGGYENMMEDGEFTWPRPFWEQPMWRWDSMFQAGVRAHYFSSRLAAQLMVPQNHGLIVNISYWSAQKHLGNVAYGVAKAATDKMSADMAHELRQHNVCVLSLYPGLVRTEKVMAMSQWLDLSNSESPEFVGRAVAALAADPNIMARSGSVVVAASAAREYGFTDTDNRIPRPLTLADS